MEGVYNPATGEYDVYTFNNPSAFKWGVQKRFYNTVALKVEFPDGATLWEETSFIVLENYTLRNDLPR